nr:hypothetical protein [Tanacetum cinerariifolium]
MKELAEYDQSTSTDRHIFLYDNGDHPVQNKESPENSSEETVVSKTNQEPPQDSDIHQLIEECSIKVPEEQKQKLENTMFELVKICQEKEFLCIHDDINDLIESALDSKLLLINLNSQHLDKKEQEVKNVIEQPAKRGNHKPGHLLSMGYEHLSITPETESDKVTESNAENLLPIPSKCEKLLKDLKELAEYDQSTSTDRSIFLNDNEDHPVQNIESPENSFEENVVSKTNQEPPQDSNNCQLIREECCIEVPEQQKQKMEDTMFDLVKICHIKQFLCIQNDIDDLIESALDSKLLSINFINSQRLDKKEQEVKNVEEQSAERRNLAPILSTKEHENSLSMRYEHLRITPETESDEVTESNAKNLLPIPSKCEVTSEDKRECDELVCDNHFDTFSDSKIDDDILVYDNDFEDIEYVEASFLNPKIVSIEEENEGDIYFLEELLIDDSILSHESFDSSFEDSPLIPRPPPELIDVETDVGEEIAVVMNDKDKFDDDYQIFMFDKVFSLLFAESEDTIFDPGLSPRD